MLVEKRSACGGSCVWEERSCSWPRLMGAGRRWREGRSYEGELHQLACGHRHSPWRGPACWKRNEVCHSPWHGPVRNRVCSFAWSKMHSRRRPRSMAGTQCLQKFALMEAAAFQCLSNAPEHVGGGARDYSQYSEMALTPLSVHPRLARCSREGFQVGLGSEGATDSAVNDSCTQHISEGTEQGGAGGAVRPGRSSG